MLAIEVAANQRGNNRKRDVVAPLEGRRTRARGGRAKREREGGLGSEALAGRSVMGVEEYVELERKASEGVDAATVAPRWPEEDVASTSSDATPSPQERLMRKILRDASAKVFSQDPQGELVLSQEKRDRGSRAAGPQGGGTWLQRFAEDLEEYVEALVLRETEAEFWSKAKALARQELEDKGKPRPPVDSDDDSIDSLDDDKEVLPPSETPRSASTASSGWNERLGPATVCLDACNGDVILDERRLSIKSLSNFCSARTNCCVIAGAWQYEVVLGTAGIQQIGWATPTCPVTNEEGVGDFPNSYAYDGKRVRKWNMSCHPYGQPWMAGDVIGCCLDVDGGEISFYRNGRPLGVAFRGVRRHTPGMAYFPALSLSHGERCALNFGGMPFRYPVSGYRPIQESPKKSLLQVGALVLEVLDVVACSDIVRDSLTTDEYFLMVDSLCAKLEPALLSPYFVDGTLIPFLLERTSGEGGELAAPRCVSLLSENLSDEEISSLTRSVFGRISELCRSSFCAEGAAVTGSRNHPYLRLGIALLENPRIRSTFFASEESFVEPIEGMLSQKQPNSHDLAALLPEVWWEGAEDAGIDEGEMKAACSSLEEAMAAVEASQVRLLLCVLRHSRGTFKALLRAILSKNKGALRNVQPPGLSDNSVLTSLYYALLRLVRPLLAENNEKLAALLPSSAFSEMFLLEEEPGHYSDASRLGGAYSHLRKTVEVAGLAETELEVTVPYQSVLNAGTMASEDSRALYESIFAGYHEEFLRCVEDDGELVALVFDGINWLYHLGLASKCKQASLQLQNQVSAISQLEDAAKRRDQAEPTNPEYHKHLKEACVLFREDVVESVRQCSWFKALLYPTWKQEAMFAACIFQTRLLLQISNHDRLLQFVPESYVETVMDSFHAFRRGHPPVRFLLGHGLEDVVTFLVLHFNDDRIVNPDVRDVMFQTISVLLLHRDFVVAFEENRSAQDSFIESLLSCFDSRFWIPVSNILLRLCKGMGFGQKRTNESTSLIFQQLVQDTCKAKPDLYAAFLNRLFTIMNWTATEFTVAMKEIQEREESLVRGLPPTSSDLTQQQRKCSIMFELSVNLLRLLEFVVRELPASFLGAESSSVVNVDRLLETMSFVLQHTTMGPDSVLFERIVVGAQHLTVLEKVSRFAILAPVTGILTNLFVAAQERLEEKKSDQNDFVERVASSRIDVACLEYLAHFVTGEVSSKPDLPSQQRLGNFQDFLSALKEVQTEREARVEVDDLEIPEKFLDPITYNLMRDPVALPSKVVVDRSTIVRHLQTDQTDPFSRAELTMEMVEPEEALRGEIEEWMSQQKTTK